MTLETAKALLETLIFAVEQMVVFDDYRAGLLVGEVVKALAGMGREAFLAFLYLLAENWPS